eukprot:TRINITY_DN53303_c0_g1_i1.p1 TRINITY_DN53303_c0_g1~~TRINITY_DN53303_c0_g1_i1.p1  ORF type:complete len:376 (-),score=71.98 TRINITY_DN53303_c0_g1_i1:807-1934(-)
MDGQQKKTGVCLVLGFALGALYAEVALDLPARGGSSLHQAAQRATPIAFPDANASGGRSAIGMQLTGGEQPHVEKAAAGSGAKESRTAPTSATIVLVHLVSDFDRHHTGCRKRSDGQAELVRSKNMAGFKRLLPALREALLDKVAYPVTVFYSPFDGWEADFAIFRKLLGGTEVQAIALPSFDEAHFHAAARVNFEKFEDTCHDPSGCDVASFSSRQFSYLLAYGMFFDSDVLSQYTYWLRVDANADLRGFDTDPFQLMAQEKWRFAYRQMGSSWACNVNLPKQMRDYMELNLLEPRDKALFDAYCSDWKLFSGGLEMGYVPLFQSDEYRKLLDTVFVGGDGPVWAYHWDFEHMYAMAVGFLARIEEIGEIPVKV